MELKIGDSVLFKIGDDRKYIYNKNEIPYNGKIGVLKTIVSPKDDPMGNVDFNGYTISNIYFTDLISAIDLVIINIETGLDILALKYEN